MLTTLGDSAADLYRLACGWEFDPADRAVLDEMLTLGSDRRWATPRVRVTGSSGGRLLEARALAGLFLLDENVLWSVWRPAERVPAFRRLHDLVSGNDLTAHVQRVSALNGGERIETVSGHRLAVVSRWNHGGRGFATDLLVADNVMGGQDELAEVTYCTAGSRNPQLVTRPPC